MVSVFLLTAVLAAPPIEVETLSDGRAAGLLKSLDAQGLVLETDEGPLSLPLGELVDVTFAAPTEGRPRTVEIVLGDGSRLYALDYTAREGTARLHPPKREPWELPLATVRTVRFAGADPKTDAEWDRIAALESPADLLVLRKAQALDHLEGEILGVTEEDVEFLTDGETFSVKRSKLEGLVYPRRPTDATAAACVVQLTDHSLVQARNIAWDGEQFHVESAAGLVLDVPLEAIVRLDFSHGKIVHLGDLDWDRARYERTSFFGEPSTDPTEPDLFRPRRNQSFDGEPLQLGGESYERGLALHSRTRLVYRLPREFRRFTALVGIDDRARPRGNVQLRIAADGTTLLDAVITGADEPLAIDLDISGARRLEIIVDFGTDLDVGDHLNLCQPRMIP